MLNQHRIPYKPQSACGIDELAAELSAKQRRMQSSGVAFVRKGDESNKNTLREQTVALLTLKRFPKRISILSMPGNEWKFEAALLRVREPAWKKNGWISRTRFTCVENDRYIYYSATMCMPGCKEVGVRYRERTVYAEQVVGNPIVRRYIFANVDDLMQDSAESFDVAWLDYTGPFSVERMRIVESFWKDRVRKLLVITALNGRWTQATSRAIEPHGSCLAWMQARLPGFVHQAVEYNDGAPMLQLAIEK